jgi:hypothetical protein
MGYFKSAAADSISAAGYIESAAADIFARD